MRSMTPSLYVDSHLHLDDPRFDGEREQTIDRSLRVEANSWP